MDTLQQVKASAQALSRMLSMQQQSYDLLNRYYEGEQNLRLLGLAVPPILRKFTVLVNWPRIVADARVDRLSLTGFRVGNNQRLSDMAWNLWKSSGLVEDESATLDFEIFGRSFKIVSLDENGNTIIDTVSPDDVAVHRDPVSGELDCAYRQVRDPDSQSNIPVLRLFWTRTDEYSFDGAWNLTGHSPNKAGMVPVVPAYRNWRSAVPRYQTWPRTQGVSAIKDVIAVTDAAARDLTNAQVAQETLAVPQRGVIGASQGDFVDKQGKPLPIWSSYFSSVWGIQNPNAKTFQFSSADMGNFQTMLETYARQASSVSGLPPNYFGLAADDAASADAIRSREAKLVKSIERDQRALGDQARNVMRVAVAINGGDPRSMDSCQALWLDAATPTVAQQADAVSKLYATTDGLGHPLISRETAWEQLGWSQEQIEREKTRLAEQGELDDMRIMKPIISAEALDAGDDGGSDTPADSSHGGAVAAS